MAAEQKRMHGGVSHHGSEALVCVAGLYVDNMHHC